MHSFIKMQAVFSYGFSKSPYVRFRGMRNTWVPQTVRRLLVATARVATCGGFIALILHFEKL